MTNLGPLTTKYTAVSSAFCETIHLARDTEGYWLERDDKIEDCFPANFTPGDAHYYSPGVCQHGYVYACTSTQRGNLGITVATCCPSGFTCRSTPSQDDDNNACHSTLASASSYTGDVIAYPSGTSTVIGTTTAPIQSGETVYAYGVVVERGATDPEWHVPSVLSTESTTERSTFVTRPTSTSTTSTTEPPAMGSSAQMGGLSSTAAKAAVGVGSTLGVVLILLGIVVLRKHWKSSGPPTSPKRVEAVVDVDHKPTWTHGPEIQVARCEMSGYREPGELAAHREPVEMD
ncbi:hypothetical protein F4808DRAFT_440375 [Astrocystis sublimbata]|nr:hypothetical protein F4808DRAFT_440375 [Astrocystis sublimbata]